jgi:hypothetical protein
MFGKFCVFLVVLEASFADSAVGVPNTGFRLFDVLVGDVGALGGFAGLMEGLLFVGEGGSLNDGRGTS